jgi:hypothetical protein
LYRIPQSPLGIVQYAFRALGKDEVPLQRLCFFISFDLGRMKPSQASQLVDKLIAKGDLVLRNGSVSISPQATIEPADEHSTTKLSLGDLLKQFVSPSRLSRAVGMSDSVVALDRISSDPLIIRALISGTKDYEFELNEDEKTIRHNCPDWQRMSVIHRLCKHVTKVFLLLEKDEAIRILTSMTKKPWKFTF